MGRRTSVRKQTVVALPLSSLAFLCSLVLVSSVAWSVRAGTLDLAIARFVNCPTAGTCTPDLRNYERFMAEYAFGLSPRILTSAESLGHSGFYMGFEAAFTPTPASYGKQSSVQRWDDGTAYYGKYPNMMFLPGIRIRKGLPWSFELGGSLNYLTGSSLFALGGEIKWALFEGYRSGFGGALPDLAARGSVMRVLGQTDVDMTIIGVDGTMSYTFGIGGMVSLSPYAGYQHLFTIIRTEPLTHREDNDDPTLVTYHPTDGQNWDMSTLSGPNLQRSRLFLGFRFGYELLSLGIEGSWGLAKAWDTTVDEEAITVPADGSWSIDESQLKTDVGNQFQFSASAGLEF